MTLFTLLSLQAYAQVRSENDRFEVNTIKGCAPLTVSAINTSGLDPDVNPIVWNMDWDGDKTTIEVDEGQSAARADTTYNSPGTYQILQVIGNQTNPIDTITIEVLPDDSPDFQVFNCINNTIYVDFSQDTVFDNLVVDFGDGVSNTFPNSMGSTSYQYAGQGQYTVSVQGTFAGGLANCSAFDTTITTVQQLAIAEISEVNVVGLNEIALNYELADPNVSYRLEVAQNNDQNFDFLNFDLVSSSNSYTINDSNLQTSGNYYCFRIVAVNRCDESLNQSSNLACSIFLNGTEQDLQNELSWRTENLANYEVLRNASAIGSTSNQDFLDNDVVCQEEYTYSIVGTQGGVRSVSNELQLTAQSATFPLAPDGLLASLSGTNALLSWPATPEALVYLIYRSTDGGAPMLYDSVARVTGQQLTYTDPRQLVLDVDYCYTLAIRDDCANESPASNDACIVLPSQAQVFFPNAFTPNGDGLNDTFVYRASLLASVRFMVFNRWGELLFSSEGIGEGWNGTYGNQLAPPGSYVYKLEAEDQLGNVFSKSGGFILVSPQR